MPTLKRVAIVLVATSSIRRARNVQAAILDLGASSFLDAPSFSGRAEFFWARRENLGASRKISARREISGGHFWGGN